MTYYKNIGYLLVLLWSLGGCKGDIQPSENFVEAPYSFDLDAIKARGNIVALVDNSTTSYFVYKGQPMGFEYEVLKRFADEHNLRLDIKVVYKLDNILNMLNSGEGDIVAANITVTREREKQVNFSDFLFKTKQVLIQNKNNPNQKLINDPTDLAGKSIHVRRKSSFFSRLNNLSDEIGADINIIAVSDSNDSKVMNKTIQLIEQVANGKIDFTVADENVAKVEKRLYPNIDISMSISLPQKIAWAVRTTDTALLGDLNAWLARQKRTNDYHTIMTKYFKARTILTKKLTSDYSSIKGGISPYDDQIKKYASNIDWDWRLLASQIYQESKFDQNAEAWTGAKGLLQLLPYTAQAYGIDTSQLANPDSNLLAGTNYLKWIESVWTESIPDSMQRTKFILASFNVGLGHIIDAKNLAAKFGADPTVWDDNVEDYILKKSERAFYADDVCKHGYCRGSEPYNYVREVIERYNHYRNLVEE